MGTITKTVASQWLDRIDASRQQLIDAAKTGNRVLAAFAQADARAELIASLADEEVQARLLKITDPDLAMVELANNPTDQDRVRICAIAILSGFVPGDDQFAIFGGGRDKSGNAKPGKLYTKEAGFRTLFGHLGIVPEVQTGFPEWLPYGAGKKNVWRVSGNAYCNHGDKCYTVRCVDSSDKTGGIDNRISLPGYESDNVAGVAAKARRRLLQMLWSQVSPILSEPQPDDDEIEVVQPERIEQAPVPEQTTEGQMNDSTWNHDWRTEAKRIGHTDGDPHQAITMAREMREATTVQQLEEILDRAKRACGPDKADISTRLVQKLEHYARYRVEKLMEPNA